MGFVINVNEPKTRCLLWNFHPRNDNIEKYDNICNIVGPRAPVICIGFPLPLSSPLPEATIYWGSVPFPLQ